MAQSFRPKSVAEVQVVMDAKWAAFEQAQTNKREEWLKDYKYYETFLVKDTNGIYPDEQLQPTAFKTCMSIIPKIVMEQQLIQAIMNRAPSTMDDENLKREELGFKLNALITYQLRKMKFKIRYRDYLLRQLIFGTGIAFAHWDDEELLGKNCIDLKIIDPFTFFPADYETDILSLRECFVESWHSVEKMYDTIEKMPHKYPLIDVPVGESLESYLMGMVSDDRHDADKRGTLDSADVPPISSTSAKMRVLEYYGMNGRLVTMFGPDQTRIVRNVTLPKEKGWVRPPFHITPQYVMPDQFWGVSEIKYLRPGIQDKTRLRMFRKAGIELELNGMYIADPDRCITSSLVVGPGHILEGQKDAITPVQKAPFSPISYREEEIIDQDSSEISGIGDYSAPRDPDRMDTATAVKELTGSSNARFGLVKVSMADYFIESLAERIIHLNKDRLEPFNFSITDEATGKTDTVTLTAEEIKGLDTDWDVLLMSGNAKVTEKNDFNQFISAAVAIPGVVEILSQNAEEFLKVGFGMYQIPVWRLLQKKAAPPEVATEPPVEEMPPEMPPEAMMPPPQAAMPQQAPPPMPQMPPQGPPPQMMPPQEPVPQEAPQQISGAMFNEMFPTPEDLMNLAIAVVSGDQQAIQVATALMMLADQGDQDALMMAQMLQQMIEEVKNGQAGQTPAGIQ